MRFFKPLIFAATILVAQKSLATIYLDLEEDSIPVVSLSLVLPVGFQAYSPEDSGVLNLLGEIFDQGTASVNRQEFFQKLAAFGASTGISVQNESTVWSLEFPYVKDKDYGPLFDLLAEQIRTPNFKEETFKLAKLKMNASMQSSLDNDSALIRSTATRLRAFKDFQSFPVLIDSLEKITLEKLQATYNREYLKKMDAWSGMVGPEAVLPMIEEGLKKIFPNLGSLKEGVRKKPLDFPARKKFEFKPYEVAIIIDRSDRQQTMTSYTWLKEGIPGDMKSALSQAFGSYVLADSGLNSYFGDELRNKRGLAYAVGGVGDVYLGHSILGVVANPQRARNAESTDVFGEIVKNAYEESNVLQLMPKEEWQTRFKSYQYDWILSERTADGRLARRGSLVEGEVYPDLALTSPNSWSVKSSDASEYFKNRYAGSSKMLVILGDEKELRPIVAKVFPSFKILAVPYKDLLKTETYQKLIKQY